MRGGTAEGDEAVGRAAVLRGMVLTGDLLPVGGVGIGDVGVAFRVDMDFGEFDAVREGEKEFRDLRAADDGDGGRGGRCDGGFHRGDGRSEEHTSELQSLMRISYAVFCLKKKRLSTNANKHTQH